MHVEFIMVTYGETPGRRTKKSRRQSKESDGQEIQEGYYWEEGIH